MTDEKLARKIWLKAFRSKNHIEAEKVLAAAFQQVRRDEREACAKVAETYYEWATVSGPMRTWSTFTEEIAAAIRTRKEGGA